jgi:hypothetical protein
MNPLRQLRKAIPLCLVALTDLALSSIAQAVSPSPDGGYPNQNTAEGSSALQSLTSGFANTAIGFDALFGNTTGSNNTAIGNGALFRNTIGNDNTANGFGALALDTTGNDNTAIGFGALFSTTTGFQNTASGWEALLANTSGFHNTADGFRALLSTTTGNHNMADGDSALESNTTGNFNTADGAHSLTSNTTGSGNTVLGFNADNSITTADNVICIGENVAAANVSNSCFIGNIFGATSAGGIAVFIGSSGRLGTTTSSRRFKEGIKSMDQTSELVFALKPVTFRYKKEIDPAGTSQFGLVAEDVEKVSPALVVRDKEGKPYSVRYEQVNAMLLNEFLKVHRHVQEQDAIIAQQQKQIEALTAGLQKVSAQLEVSKPAPQTVLNNQ